MSEDDLHTLLQQAPKRSVMPGIRTVTPLHERIGEYIESVVPASPAQSPEDVETPQEWYERACTRAGDRLGREIEPRGHYTGHLTPDETDDAHIRFLIAQVVDFYAEQLEAVQQHALHTDRDICPRTGVELPTEREQRITDHYDRMCALVDEEDADSGHIVQTEQGLNIVLEFHDETLLPNETSEEDSSHPDQPVTPPLHRQMAAVINNVQRFGTVPVHPPFKAGMLRRRDTDWPVDKPMQIDWSDSP